MSTKRAGDEYEDGVPLGGSGVGASIRAFAHELPQADQSQVKPGPGATVMRSLSPKTAVTVLESRDGWSLVASDGKPIGYVATRDLAPAQ